MRKLAREAVIFMLLASLLVFALLSLGLLESSSTGEAIGIALLNAWVGLPIGLGCWVLYRAVRFAVKG